MNFDNSSATVLRASPRPVIQARGLTKSFRVYKKERGFVGALKGLWHRKYEQTVAASDITFEVEEGELVGFLGPNGAGKTTTLKMLAGLLHPTSGEARILNYVPWERHNDYRRQFALLLGQKNQLWWDLPARDSLELNGKIYGLPRKDFEATIDELTSLLHVKEKLDVMVRELSLGERMKMELIAALLHRPKVLFLDEPTIGLDVVSQKVVREFLHTYNRLHKTTILLTSHYMADIEMLCRRVIIIDKGQIFFDGPLESLVERYADHKLVTVQLASSRDTQFRSRRLFGETLESTANEVRYKVRRDEVANICRAILDELPVADIDIQDVPIEDVIRNIFERRQMQQAA